LKEAFSLCAEILYRNGVGRGSYFYDREIWAVIQHSGLRRSQRQTAMDVLSRLTLSLTPCSSWVLRLREDSNRYSGFL